MTQYTDELAEWEREWEREARYGFELESDGKSALYDGTTYNIALGGIIAAEWDLDKENTQKLLNILAQEAGIPAADLRTEEVWARLDGMKAEGEDMSRLLQRLGIDYWEL